MRVLRLCLCGQEAQGAVRSVVLQILTYLMECPTADEMDGVLSPRRVVLILPRSRLLSIVLGSIFKRGSLVLSPCTEEHTV
ncbi:uncharacterized protein LOC124669325 isoform X2 [Lolium rigidum]|uniref:uncharacterized protein LOC124669325 isoform X2 n=1 Tax=Lolium rigidum TaxID=89674 RepID=UPI001F5C2F79|nr:uncharacterized protein LOC124669325 isoform X2 [Lolium rigidum]